MVWSRDCTDNTLVLLGWTCFSLAKHILFCATFWLLRVLVGAVWKSTSARCEDKGSKSLSHHSGQCFLLNQRKMSWPMTTQMVTMAAKKKRRRRKSGADCMSRGNTIFLHWVRLIACLRSASLGLRSPSSSPFSVDLEKDEYSFGRRKDCDYVFEDRKHINFGSLSAFHFRVWRVRADH